jgi:hypothetical protein
MSDVHGDELDRAFFAPHDPPNTSLLVERGRAEAANWPPTGWETDGIVPRDDSLDAVLQWLNYRVYPNGVLVCSDTSGFREYRGRMIDHSDSVRDAWRLVEHLRERGMTKVQNTYAPRPRSAFEARMELTQMKGSLTAPAPEESECRCVEEALHIIYDTGRAMERHPADYLDKDECALCDRLITSLCPRFPNTMRESFNKTGKTDILVRHNGQNVFIAECKIWHGSKALLDAIDQLTSYLTWRDTQAGIIMFVRNKEISNVLSTIESDTPKHACYVKTGPAMSEGWFSFEFHLPGDAGQKIDLSILVFHFPDSES